MPCIAQSVQDNPNIHNYYHHHYEDSQVKVCTKTKRAPRPPRESPWSTVWGMSFALLSLANAVAVAVRCRRPLLSSSPTRKLWAPGRAGVDP
jgi:hypothetical protein